METSQVITEEHAKQRRMEAVYGHEEAKNERARLVLEAKKIGRQLAKRAAMYEALEFEPDFPLQSEAALLMLSQHDYEGQGFEPERKLLNAIAGSRKKVKDAAEVRRIYNDCKSAE